MPDDYTPSMADGQSYYVAGRAQVRRQITGEQAIDITPYSHEFDRMIAQVRAETLREFGKSIRTWETTDDVMARSQHEAMFIEKEVGRHDSTDTGSVAPPSDASSVDVTAPSLTITDAEVEAGAEAMQEQGPANTPVWDDWVWHRFARAALLAAQEVRRNG